MAATDMTGTDMTSVAHNRALQKSRTAEAEI